ncbi:hypothetical protein VI34_02970 [Methylophilales bacterium MBRSG12]|uniref:DUF2946 domain-containing protein n=1 Tax=Methylophilales bacterium MBRS-H7 TaxID=1623450 RepID=A0A0H4IZ01_9PROT|nr:hypothetical protein UZ34_00150 [Methylophilales bacterium MBRSF5]AKO65714.1 hypothetical protein VI33_02970 [Methylophilales bacterium MBRS-H7]AKO67035.1 hypothetical protein VI34_02970 [Methylophilales bacterium MBRSG12]
MVLRKITIFALIILAFMQWTSVQHDMDHIHEAFYVAHCEDESKEDSKEFNHCENCNIFNQLAYVISNDDHTLFNKQLNSTLNDSYRIFAFTHFYSINSVRGPPQIS